MSLSDASLTPALRAQLLGIAAAAIDAGLRGRRLAVHAADYSPPLCLLRASFVTLRFQLKLRGCIGSLEANRPLADDVAHNAYAAAFEDPRFAPLTEPEFSAIDIHLSLLGAAEPMRFASEEDLLAQLQPHVDGVVLQDGNRLGTFLPTVWQVLPDPREFLRELKRKAGLPENYWSPDICCKRYIVEEISGSIHRGADNAVAVTPVA
jgi:AmmeMemoRadiSam system protein A